MSKNSYIFEYLISGPKHLAGKIGTRKIRAMNEQEAKRRFNQWVEYGDHDFDDFEIESSRIAKTDDISLLEKQGRIIT